MVGVSFIRFALQGMRSARPGCALCISRLLSASSVQASRSGEAYDVCDQRLKSEIQPGCLFAPEKLAADLHCCESVERV